MPSILLEKDHQDQLDYGSRFPVWFSPQVVQFSRWQSRIICCSYLRGLSLTGSPCSVKPRRSCQFRFCLSQLDYRRPNSSSHHIWLIIWPLFSYQVFQSLLGWRPLSFRNISREFSISSLPMTFLFYPFLDFFIF